MNGRKPGTMNFRAFMHFILLSKSAHVVALDCSFFAGCTLGNKMNHKREKCYSNVIGGALNYYKTRDSLVEIVTLFWAHKCSLA